jgi:hypothetical protein
MPKQSRPQARPERPEDVRIEPGAEKRLANILKKALNTPPARSAQKQKAPAPAPARKPQQRG